MLQLGNIGYLFACLLFVCLIKRIKHLNKQVKFYLIYSKIILLLFFSFKEQTIGIFVKKINLALLTIMITGIFFGAENSTFSYANLDSFYIRYEKANFGSGSNWIKFLEEILIEFTIFFSKVNFNYLIFYLNFK